MRTYWKVRGYWRMFKVSVVALMLVATAWSLLDAVQPGAVAAPTHPDAAIEYAFTQADEHPEKLLIGVIDSAITTLDVAIYSLTHPDIVKAIKNAKKRGVAVRILTDEQQSAGKTQKEALKILKSAGIDIRVDKHSGLQHLKVTIADKKVVTTGSFNYSKAASTVNDEVLVVIRDPRIAGEWSKEFGTMWSDEKRFEVYKQ